MKYIVNVEGVIIKRNKILITQRGEGEDYLPGILGLPGGKVEIQGNTPAAIEETLYREIREEVGIEVEGKMDYLESKTLLIEGETVLDVVFLCYYKSGRARAHDPEEVAESQWMTYDQILSGDELPQWTLQSINLAADYLGWS